jgi:hypothetical protein
MRLKRNEKGGLLWDMAVLQLVITEAGNHLGMGANQLAL